MATERIAPTGLATSLPASSGAEPCTASYIPMAVYPRLAEGASPTEPVNAAASSDKRSPNRLEVSITSNCFGLRTSSMAAWSA